MMVEILIAVLVGGALVLLGMIACAAIILLTLVKFARTRKDPVDSGPIKSVINAVYGRRSPIDLGEDDSKAYLTQDVMDVSSLYPSNPGLKQFGKNFMPASFADSEKMYEERIEIVKGLADKQIDLFKEIGDNDPTQEQLDDLSDLNLQIWKASRGRNIEE